MGINTCSWIMDNDEPCGERTEGNTSFCGSHNRQLRKEKENETKSLQKRAQLLSKPKQVRKAGNSKAKCSYGESVNVHQIVLRKSISYKEKYYKALNTKCEGCGGEATCHAHIIPQARCKQIHKAELIWDLDNFFDSCNACNLAIENPKGEAWKKLLNISHCLQFMERNDRELFSKFESRLTTQRENTI